MTFPFLMQDSRNSSVGGVCLSTSPLWVVAYDAHQAASRNRLRQVVQHPAIGHQRSVYEQFPSLAEQGELLQQLQEQKKPSDDLWVFAIDPRSQKIALGTAVPPRPFAGLVIS